MKNLYPHLLRSVFGVLLVFLIFSLPVGGDAAVEPPPAFLTQWMVDGSPYRVAVDSEGNVYVADTGNFRIQKFDTDGNFLTQWGSYGTGKGYFRSPWGVAVDSVGYVYVADTGNNRIQKFDTDGNFLIQWGRYGRGEGQFRSPYGVAVDSEGNVYAADTYNFRIQKFDTDGALLTQWRVDGSPWGVAVDSAGNVYVTDVSHHHIQKFDTDGNFLTQWGSNGWGEGQFCCPYGVAVDSVGCVYVADTYNYRIQKFGNPSIDVDIRIKGQSPLNVKSRGVLPVTILGTDVFDVTQVDPSSVKLEGISPLRWSLEDVATPFEALIGREDCYDDCTSEGADGCLDLSLKFDTQEVVSAIHLVKDGDCLVLTLTGNLKGEYGDTPIVGEDTVIILKKGK
jgi:DNA-binding beta-propeller fold protein YncE